MKQHLLSAFIATILLCSFNSHAQLFSGDPANRDSTAPKVEFGIKAGLNLQKMASDSTWEDKMNPGFAGGIFMQTGKNKFGVRVEVLASTAHYTFKYITDSLGTKGDFTSLSIDIPLLLEYKVVPFLWIQAGLQYSSIISIHNKAGFDGDSKLLFKNGGFAATGGLEARLPMKFIAGARYSYGFTNLNNNTIFTAEPWKTSAVQIYVGYIIK